MASYAAKRSGLSRYCQYSKLGMGSRSDAGKERRLVCAFHVPRSVRRAQKCQIAVRTNMAAISLTPKHLLTNCIIILSFPPSPVSPESGTEIGGVSSSITSHPFLGDTVLLISRENKQLT